MLNSESRRWVIKERDSVAEDLLIRELGIPRLAAAILAQRGITDPAQADKFLNPKLSDLHSAKTLPDFEPAVKAILGARDRGELIYVHGDYDVDGVTSAAILSRFLERIKCKVHTHVPHRMKEGNGIHESAVEAAKALGAKLFLTCDCGIAAIEQVKQAREAGMAVVVTDHHSVGEQIPDADAVVNPHRLDSKYPFCELSGAGVVFKLCAGITEELGCNVDQYYRAYLDLAALGTIADVMPLTDENRIIARHGLHRLAETQKVGLQALMQVANVKIEPGVPLRSYHVGFVLGPRLNAAGRIDDASIALQLLLENDFTKAVPLAAKLEEINTARKQEQQRIIEEASQLVLEQNMTDNWVIVLAKEGWHPGVVGIAAGRIAEQFRRPTFVMAISEDGIAKGSARSIPGFNLAESIWAYPELFLSGGGHAAAAGCSFDINRIGEVRSALNEFAHQHLTEADFVPVIQADLLISPEEVTLDAVQALSLLEPFGSENPEPTFIAPNWQLASVTPTRNPIHAQLSLKHETGAMAKGIAFHLGERLTKVSIGSSLQVLFQPTVDEWNGRKNLKWQVKDFSVTGSE